MELCIHLGIPEKSVPRHWYAANFGNYNETYGSLGAAIVFMTWMWLSCTIILLVRRLMQKSKPKMQKLGQVFFQRNAVDVARELIGAELHFDGTGGIIVEAEAYLIDDPASHSFKGQSQRNGSMFGPAGFSYVYRSYGIHWCLNAVCLPGSAVLIRALEPRTGIDLMRARRGVDNMRLICSGPGRLCQALGIDGSRDGEPLNRQPFVLRKDAAPPPLVVGKRIGITRAMDQPWRFGLQGSKYVSRKF